MLVEHPIKVCSGHLISTVLLVTLSNFFASSALAMPVRILVLDAHNGRPVKGTDVSVAIMGEKSAASFTTDKTGTIVVDMKLSDKFIPSTGWRVTCRKISSTSPHWFSAETIIEHGAVDENTCGKAHFEPPKGALVIFTRQSTFFENMAR